MPKPKILIAGSPEFLQNIGAEDLEDLAELIVAPTILDGAKLFNDNPDIKLIIVDDQLPKGPRNTQKINSFGLILHIRHTFTGPIVTTSSHVGLRKKLLKESLLKAGPERRNKDRTYATIAQVAIQLLDHGTEK